MNGLALPTEEGQWVNHDEPINLTNLEAEERERWTRRRRRFNIRKRMKMPGFI